MQGCSHCLLLQQGLYSTVAAVLSCPYVVASSVEQCGSLLLLLTSLLHWLLPQGDTAKAGRLGFVAGLIPQEKLNGFERLLFRCAGVKARGRVDSRGRQPVRRAGQADSSNAYSIIQAAGRAWRMCGAGLGLLVILVLGSGSVPWSNDGLVCCCAGLRVVTCSCARHLWAV